MWFCLNNLYGQERKRKKLIADLRASVDMSDKKHEPSIYGKPSVYNLDDMK